MKCNLNCSYCGTGIYKGHDNSTAHPDTAGCLDAIDFMFEYADTYMANKVNGIRYAVLNVYGGESLHHPDIVKILQSVHEQYRPYRDRWHLTVTTTTNAIISDKKLQKIIPLVDEFTVSYHAENSQKQKQQFKDNLLTIKQSGQRLKCVIPMHSESTYFDDDVAMINWLKQNDIPYLPKPLDHDSGAVKFNYNSQQVVWFERLYKKTLNHTVVHDNKTDLADIGRPCCGGRQLCENQQHKTPQIFVANKFPGWYCSVNQFFLYVKQVNGEVYVNKDCKMNYDGGVGPIGNLDNTAPILLQARDSNRPIIRCAKERCHCGLCAPKAADLDTYQTMMRKYEIPNSNLLPKG